MERAARSYGVGLQTEPQFGYWRGTAESSGRITFADGVSRETAIAVLSEAAEQLDQDALVMFTGRRGGEGGRFEVPVERLVSLRAIEIAVAHSLPDRSASLCNGWAYFYESDWDRGVQSASRLAEALRSTWSGHRGDLTMIAGAEDLSPVEAEAAAA